MITAVNKKPTPQNHQSADNEKVSMIMPPTKEAIGVRPIEPMVVKDITFAYIDLSTIRCIAVVTGMLIAVQPAPTVKDMKHSEIR